MDKEFLLAFLKRNAIVFDVKDIEEIKEEHVDLSLVNSDTFVAFYSWVIEKFNYGTEEYFRKHPQLFNSIV